MTDPAPHPGPVPGPAPHPIPERPRIAVCAATFHRPDGLRLLLDRLERLTFEDGPEPPIEVVIVDNAPDGGARAAVEARAEGYRFPLHYEHQTERGIAQARNRALEAATRVGADWLAFIDDDEYPDPRWLDRLVAVARSTGASAVLGAVEPDFEVPPPRWIERGGFLAITRYGEGEILPFGNTSNVLFDLDLANALGLRFDLAFALTGGEDTLFFDRLRRAGGTIVFARSAVAHETIVPHRARLGWMVERWVRSGNTDGRIAMLNAPGLRTRIGTVLGGGLARLGVGGAKALLSSPLALVGRGDVPAEQLRVAARGWGFLLSGFGTVIEEYRTMDR